MNIDERIQQALQQDAAEIDRVLAEQDTLKNAAFGFISSGIPWWKAVIIITAIPLVPLFWYSIYRFFSLTQYDSLAFWGMATFLCASILLGVKIWSWVETMRLNLSREVKTLELSILRQMRDPQD